MTEKQINWAKQHDWFIGVTADGEGVVVLDVWVDLRDGKTWSDSKVFTNYYRLRGWAGY